MHAHWKSCRNKVPCKYLNGSQSKSWNIGHFSQLADPILATLSFSLVPCYILPIHAKKYEMIIETHLSFLQELFFYKEKKGSKEG